MARLPLLLLFWALAAGPGRWAEARAAPHGVKLCGREFIRAVIFTCGGSRWRRSGTLAHGAVGNTFLDADTDPDSLVGDLEEAVASREWLALTKPPQAFYGGQPGWQSPRGARDVLAGLSSNCCKWGCSKNEISSLC